MSRSVRPVVSLLWRRGDLTAMLILLATWAAYLSWQAAHRSADLADRPVSPSERSLP